VSHSQERNEKICLNCEANLYNRYCHVCGQENVEPKETVWGIVSHFAYDITHFDGKFFGTIKDLIRKPGFLSLEHIKGRRARYLHPIRLYVFTSAFFFIIFFSLIRAEDLLKTDLDPAVVELEQKKHALASLKLQEPDEKDSVVKSTIQRVAINFESRIDALQTEIDNKKIKDSVALKERRRIDSVNLANALAKRGGNLPARDNLSKMIDSVAKLNEREKNKKDNGNGVFIETNDKKERSFFSMGDVDTRYLTKEAYDAVQKELPLAKRHGWFERSLSYKSIELNEKVGKDEIGTWATLIDGFLHSFPQVLFVSLPFFALLLQLLYIRQKKYYYADHMLFSIHLYCASFIIILFILALNWLQKQPFLSWISIIQALLYLSIFFYLYKAMRRFYGQGRFKTITKFLLLNFLSFILMTVISGVFFILSVWKVK
jgi:Protein of unknown function (DUF3667)